MRPESLADELYSYEHSDQAKDDRHLAPAETLTV